MHIHPSSPDSTLFLEPEASAAIKIQAGFRGYRVRKNLHQQQKNRKPKINGYISQHSKNATMIENTQKNENSQNASNVSTSNYGATCNDDEIEKCATKIQAGVRGFLVRKKQKLEADAATKIQAGFRGFKARKDIEKLKQK